MDEMRPDCYDADAVILFDSLSKTSRARFMTADKLSVGKRIVEAFLMVLQ